LIALFAKEKLSQKDLQAFFHAMQKMTIEECDPAKEFTKSQKHAVDEYLKRVLHIKKGVQSTFVDFADGLAKYGIKQFDQFLKLALQTKAIFDSKGQLTPNRTKLFTYLTEVIKALESGKPAAK
jgi:hypothetical protein